MILVQPVVEGHGETGAVRIVLERIAAALGSPDSLRVLRAIRQPRGRLLRERDLTRVVDLAARNLVDQAGSLRNGLVLVVLDADDAPACRLAPQLLEQARRARSDADVAVVLAVREFETWFVASADSMTDLLDLGEPPDVPAQPESAGMRKAWVEERMRSGNYSPVVDQPRLAARIDVDLCRRRSPSFDKLCREIAARVAAPSGG